MESNWQDLSHHTKCPGSAPVAHLTFFHENEDDGFCLATQWSDIFSGTVLHEFLSRSVDDQYKRGWSREGSREVFPSLVVCTDLLME